MKPFGSIVAIALVFPSLPTVAGDSSDTPSISGDASLNRAMDQYRQQLPDDSAWRNPYVPAPSTMADADSAAGSGDLVLARSVAHYTRARLDAGGWKNAFMHDEHYASGNPILLVRPGEGITTAPAGPAEAEAEAENIERTATAAK